MHFPKTMICGVALTGLIALGGLVGCSTSPASPHASDTAGEPFALGHLNSTAHVLAFVAQEEGYFADEGLDVSLVQLSSGTEMVSALEAGKLDAAFIGSVPAIVAQSNGHDVSIFGGAMSNGHGSCAARRSPSPAPPSRKLSCSRSLTITGSPTPKTTAPM